MIKTTPIAELSDESLARVVRDAFVAWAKEQPNPKASWLVAWDELPADDPQREADKRIAAAVRTEILTTLFRLNEKQRRELSAKFNEASEKSLVLLALLDDFGK